VNPFSLVPTLNLGLLDDTDAVDELFARPPAEMIFDKGIIIKIGDLLRSDEGNDYFAEKLRSFTGVITEDEEHDGYPESRAFYSRGEVQEFHYDADQDGLHDLSVTFASGSPSWADIEVLPYAAPSPASQAAPNQNRQGSDRRVKSLIFWEEYPAVQRVVLGKETFQFAPNYFQFAPLNLEQFGEAGFIFPCFDPLCQSISRRMLASFAVTVQRPSAEFDGGVEQIHLERGLPIHAEVVLGGRTVSVTEYENGRAVIQRLDLNLDGQMDTVRRFHRITSGARTLGADELLDFRPPLESVENIK
jgi:hypothetical protein